MDLSEIQFLHNTELLVRPRPLDAESWGGYLLRLAVRNSYRGVNDLALVLGMKATELLAARPEDVLHRFGVQWRILSSHHGHNRAGRKVKRVLDSGQPVNFRFCPLCLREDSDPYIRAEWDGALGLICSKHDVALLSECSECGEPPSYMQRSHLRCRCGASYSNHQASPAPDHAKNLLMIFSEAQVKQRETFSRSTQLEYEAAAVANWLLEPVDPTTGQRKRRARWKHKVLDAKTLAPLASALANWPQSAVDLVRSEYALNERNPAWFLKRRLEVQKFKEMGSLVRSLEEDVSRVEAVRLDENRRILWEPVKSTFTLRDLERLTRIDYRKLVYLCQSGKIPDSVQGGEKVGRYFGIEIPSAVYRAIAKAYEQTDSTKHAAQLVGCSEDAMKGLVRSKNIPAYGLDPSIECWRVYPKDAVAFAQKMFALSQDGMHLNHEKRVKFSNLVKGEYTWQSPKKWSRVMTAIQAGKLTLFRSTKDPIALDELFVTEEHYRKVIRPR